jgi:hypothetical protein
MSGVPVTTGSLRADHAVGPRASVDPLAGWWRLELALVGLVLVGLATLLPLYDPDLPMHLATGEWIVEHGRVPLVEPFAWTRAGAPFYAYSWLPETIFYLVHRALGPVGLRLLQGLLLAGVGLATMRFGRVAGWHVGTMVCVPAFSVLVAALTTPSLRPQIVLLIVVPLVWAEVLGLRDGGSRGWAAVRLVLLSAAAANSHLFFPLVLAPVALLLVDSPVRWPRAVVAGAALVGGWSLTPYVRHWPALLRANFASNAMLAWPSPIAELQPGFLSVLRLEVVGVAALLLLLLPWSGLATVGRLRERALAALYWTIGLVAFAYAVRLLIVWWLLVLPFAGVAVERRAAGEAGLPRLRFRLPAYGVLLALLGVSVGRSARGWSAEGTTESRTLTTIVARGAEPLAAWLDEHMRPGARGRLFTVFNYGSYLTWRLPSVSPSIDGRAIFPDSVARAESLLPADRDSMPVGPWRSADLAILPLNRRMAGVLDTAAGWRRIATALPDTGDADASALWVRDVWWREAGAVPLPQAPLRLRIAPR